jgi:hypothetical protein
VRKRQAKEFNRLRQYRGIGNYFLLNSDKDKIRKFFPDTNYSNWVKEWFMRGAYKSVFMPDFIDDFSGATARSDRHK